MHTALAEKDKPMSTPKPLRTAAEIDRDFPRLDQPIAVPADDLNIYTTFAALLRQVPNGYDKVDVRTSLDRATGVLTITVQATRANTPAEYAMLRKIMRDHGDQPATLAYNLWIAELPTPIHYIADFDLQLGDQRLALIPDARRNEPRDF